MQYEAFLVFISAVTISMSSVRRTSPIYAFKYFLEIVYWKNLTEFIILNLIFFIFVLILLCYIILWLQQIIKSYNELKLVDEYHLKKANDHLKLIDYEITHCNHLIDKYQASDKLKIHTQAYLQHLNIEKKELKTSIDKLETNIWNLNSNIIRYTIIDNILISSSFLTSGFIFFIHIYLIIDLKQIIADLRFYIFILRYMPD